MTGDPKHLMSHVVVNLRAKVYTDSTGAFAELPVLLTEGGLLSPLLDYFVARRHDRSLAWMKKVVRSTQLFLDYLQSNPAERDTYRLFQNFAQRLYTGTFDRSTGIDPSGLCWRALGPQDCAHIVNDLTGFFGWLGEVRPSAAQVNPRYAGDAFDRMTDEAAYKYRRDRAFLGHTWATNATDPSSAHLVRYKRAPKVEQAEPPQFPDERFMELLTEGFKVGRGLDLRNILITLLLHGAGFRASEPFHLYVSDVIPDPSNERSALVRIHHPSFGEAPADWRGSDGQSRRGNRAVYLAEKFALVPRTELLGSQSAGWKGGSHDGPYYKQAHWFLPEFGELFLTVWQKYMHEVAVLNRPHPFAFVNLRSEPRAAMYCLPQFNKAHRAACERIGLKVAKHLGTTPHGHRHAYGKRLSNAGVDEFLIRRFMHHASVESQGVYTQPTSKEARDALAAAAQRLGSTSLGTSLSNADTIFLN